MDETQGFLYWAFKLDHLRPLELILFNEFSDFDHYSGAPISYYPREGEMRKGIHSEMDETQGILYLGHSNWTICGLWS